MYRRLRRRFWNFVCCYCISRWNLVDNVMPELLLEHFLVYQSDFVIGWRHFEVKHMVKYEFLTSIQTFCFTEQNRKWFIEFEKLIKSNERGGRANFLKFRLHHGRQVSEHGTPISDESCVLDIWGENTSPS